MAFDQSTRNRLQSFVSKVRQILIEEFTRQLQNEYGLDPLSGSVTPIEKLSHLDDARLETANTLRSTLSHYLASSSSSNSREALERITREQAFTVLNRLAALRMAEARGFLRESLANGYNSKGFQLYLRLADNGLGETGEAYRNYLFSIFDEFTLDLRILFDRFSPYGLLFPREATFLEVLELINDPEIAPLWAEDETIGWIYQYFNSKDERKKMRDESAAPRNSRELAVRNQFFTPRYVVEFLTDNTLGRIWYEMTKGETLLKDRCRYLVQRPNEIFLAPNENAPTLSEDDASTESLSQEELLKQPVYISYRPLKDPREIRVLDPACGSMHFGLYAFDLLELIYQESWEIEETKGVDSFLRLSPLTPLHKAYSDKQTFLRDIPRLIIEYNLHGIDIDPRAVQIAGLSLWQRAQRTWQQQKVRPIERPNIRRSNIVCAEPMPGEEAFLKEFISKHLSSTPEEKLLAQLINRVFEAMKLAGEAGSLLKIEEEIADVVKQAKEKWLKHSVQEMRQEFLFADMTQPIQEKLAFDVTEITDEKFWEEAEELIYRALQAYAEQTEEGSYQRRLFAEDAVRGFAFVDICRKKYDVVLMNPPFGQPIVTSTFVLKKYSNVNLLNLYTFFLARAATMVGNGGVFGLISDSTFLKQPTFFSTRQSLLSEISPLYAIVDLGWEVLDANVRTAAFVCGSLPGSTGFWALDLSDVDKDLRGDLLQKACVDSVFTFKYYSEIKMLPKSVFALNLSANIGRKLSNMQSLGEISSLPWGCGANDSFQLFRLRWEVPLKEISISWVFMTNGGTFSPFYRENFLLCRYQMENGDSAFITKFRNGTDYLYDASGQDLYFSLGLTYPKRSEFFHVSILPKGHIFTPEGKGLFILDDKKLWFFLGLLNSSFITSIAGIVCGPHKQRGDVGLIKIPQVNSLVQKEIAEQAETIFHAGRKLMQSDECSSWFCCLGIFQFFTDSLKEFFVKDTEATSRVLSDVLNRMKNIDFLISSSLPPELLSFCSNEDLHVEREKLWIDININTHDILSYVVGCFFGRWNICLTTGEKIAPELPDPFAPLPICPPGMLQNNNGLPAEPKDVPNNYPLRITWNGIVVDDPGHPEDIEERVHEVLQVIWKDCADTIEHQACHILKVDSLREYFRKSTNFFAEHLTRYSKSRRQAPIYWPLSTTSGSYTLWIYYHRLNDQTLYSCVNDFVEPKLRQVNDSINKLSSKHNRNRDEEKEYERFQDLEIELKDFRDELLRLAKLPWKPNLNDGVQITAAPLWKLFRLPKWQKILKETWEKLEKGEYDWAHLTYTLWPERVKEKCKKDKSLAITHDLEELYQEPQTTTKKRVSKKAADKTEVMNFEEVSEE